MRQNRRNRAPQAKGCKKDAYTAEERRRQAELQLIELQAECGDIGEMSCEQLSTAMQDESYSLLVDELRGRLANAATLGEIYEYSDLLPCWVDLAKSRFAELRASLLKIRRKIAKHFKIRVAEVTTTHYHSYAAKHVCDPGVLVLVDKGYLTEADHVREHWRIPRLDAVPVVLDGANFFRADQCEPVVSESRARELGIKIDKTTAILWRSRWKKRNVYVTVYRLPAESVDR